MDQLVDIIRKYEFGERFKVTNVWSKIRVLKEEA